MPGSLFSFTLWKRKLWVFARAIQWPSIKAKPKQKFFHLPTENISNAFLQKINISNNY